MTPHDVLWTRVQNSLDRQGMMRHLGVRLLRVEPGLVELALPYSDKVTQQQDGFHGGAMGALGALIMALTRRRLSLSLLKQALNTTTKLSCFVVFILIGSTIFSLVFQGVDGPRWVEHLLTGLPGGQIGFLIVVNILIFFLAFFLDFFELSFIVVPLLAPVAHALGIDLIWFGVLLAVNMQTSFMHPPFGFALFYLRSVAPTLPYTDRVTKKLIQPVTTMQIYWGAVPFVVIQIIMVGLIIAFPGIVSSEIEKPKVVDMEKIRLQMEADVNQLEAAEMATPDAGSGAAADTPGGLMPEPEPLDAPAVEDSELFKPKSDTAPELKK